MDFTFDLGPVTITLECGDTPVGTYDDGWGVLHDVYRVETVRWTEKAGLTWRVQVTHPTTGQPVLQVIEPYEVGLKNLPTPARFNHFPLTINCTWVRV